METLFFNPSRAFAAYYLLQNSAIYGESHSAWMTRDVHRITQLFIALNTATFLYNIYTIKGNLSLAKKPSY